MLSRVNHQDMSPESCWTRQKTFSRHYKWGFNPNFGALEMSYDISICPNDLSLATGWSTSLRAVVAIATLMKNKTKRDKLTLG